MSNLRSIIEDEIAKTGMITFRRFMELALYCPNFGYYEKSGMGPGREGDFYTSVSVGGLFGELLALQFADWLEQTPEGPRQILEAGAHDGSLARDILGRLRAIRPGLFDGIEYWILEPSARRREAQELTLRKFSGKVRWFQDWGVLLPLRSLRGRGEGRGEVRVPGPGALRESLADGEVPEINGIIFANELLDAMPVNRISWDAAKREWFEWCVGMEGDSLVWKRGYTPLPDSRPWTLDPACGRLWTSEELLAVLPDGFTTEICPAAIEWWKRAAGKLRCGRLMTFDYGLEAEEFFAPERKAGTLRAYHRHHQSGDLLAQPGEQDITAHVNFTGIREAGEIAGLTTGNFETQARFLTKVLQRASSEAGFKQWFGPAHARQFQTLTHPEHLGERFRALVQTRIM